MKWKCLFKHDWWEHDTEWQPPGSFFQRLSDKTCLRCGKHRFDLSIAKVRRKMEREAFEKRIKKAERAREDHAKVRLEILDAMISKE